MIFFQALLLALLALPLALGRAPPFFLAAAFLALSGIAAFRLLGFDAANRRAGAFMLGFFALWTLAVLAALWVGIGPVPVLAAGVLSFSVFFVFLSLFFSRVSCELLGYSNGYAVVCVPRQVAGLVPAGVLAVACAKKPKARTVVVRFSWDKKGTVVG